MDSVNNLCVKPLAAFAWNFLFLAKSAKIKTRKGRKEIMNTEHLYHARIVATTFSAGAGDD
jgi:hypothetical protein